MAAPGEQVPAQGGEGAVNVTASRDCTWSAASEAAWLTITAGRAGQGDGTVTFRAAENGDPASRRGAVVLNETRVEIVQAAAACRYLLAAESAAFGPAGGGGHVEVQPSSTLCSWTASADVPWIALETAEGRGSGRVSFTVAPNSGVDRTGRITVAGQSFTVAQTQPAPGGCAYQVEPLAITVPAIGGSAPIRVTTTAGCAWTALSAAPWVSIAGAASGTGSATVTIAASGSPGPARTGTAIVAGQQIAVAQLADVPPPPSPAPPAPPAPAPTPQPPPVPPPAPPAACTYAVAPQQGSIAPAGGPGSFALQTGAACAWTATSAAPWITVTDAEGAGPRTIRFQAAANTGAARTGTVSVGGATFTLQQPAGCAYILSATSRDLPAEGGSASIDVTAGADCAWSASTSDSWLTVVSGATGQGNGTVRFAATAHTGQERTGTIRIAGQTVTVVQAGACTVAISPTQDSVGAAGGRLVVSVSAASACAWTASSAAPWITVSHGASGSGAGDVRLDVAANTSTQQRTGTVTIAGRTFTVTQAGAAPPPGCSAEVTPDTIAAPASGGNVQLRVTIEASCRWQSETNVPWIRITAGAQSTGSGPVLLQIQSNPGPERTATVTVAGVTVTVVQAGQ